LQFDFASQFQDMHDMIPPVVLPVPRPFCPPRLAVTSQAFACVRELTDFCEINDCFAVEYTFRRGALSRQEVARERADVKALLRSGIFVRYHLAFPGFELGHPDPQRAEEARAFYSWCLETVADLGGDRVTLHVGLDGALRGRVDYAAAAAGLGEVVRRGETLGVQVCLENLRLGATGDPRRFRSLLDRSGAFATLDVGHAAARELAAGTPGLALEFIPNCNGRLLGAHVYEIEAAVRPGGPVRHQAPASLDRIRPLLDAMLMETACDWWLIELMDPADLARTLGLVRRHLDGMAAAATLAAPSCAASHHNREDLA
jgi:sugar phosphate isomerase/epimerase